MRMAQQLRQPLHDGQAEAKAAAALAGRIVELMELLEDRLKLLFGDAEAGVPDLDPQLVATPPAAEQQPCPSLVYFTALDSRLRIIWSSRRGSLRTRSPQGTTRQPRPLASRVIGELGPQPLEQIVDREVDDLGGGRPRPRAG